jgi:hypothetical protein
VSPTVDFIGPATETVVARHSRLAAFWLLAPRPSAHPSSKQTDRAVARHLGTYAAL